MYKTTLVIITAILFIAKSNAQSSAPEGHLRKDSIAPAKTENKDSLKMARLLAKAYYPLIKSSKWSGVIPVDHPEEKPDPAQRYKLLFELTYNNPDSVAKEINGGLAEIGRIINLHVASGIPAKNIEPVIVVHGPALRSFYDNMNYQKKYNIPNPNLAIIKELKEAAKAQFIACGQAMAFFDVSKDQMIPGIKVSLTAQTVLSNYQLKRFVLYQVNDVK